MKKNTLLLLIALIPYLFYSQNKIREISDDELNMKFYKQDSTANAIVLYEESDSKFITRRGYIQIETTVYKKIKIFNKKGNSHATVKVNLYLKGSENEVLKDIKAITHNLNEASTHLLETNIYRDEAVQDKWLTVKFTLPNIKEGSVIEYQYTKISPHIYHLPDWYFQSSIPKVKSVYKALIPGNYRYNSRLIGFLKLTENEQKIKKRCFHVSGASNEADCIEARYAIENIPAFIEEDYMTSKENYISHIKNELATIFHLDGSKNDYTKTWKSVDKEFKTDKDTGKQLKKQSYFREKLPLQLLTEPDELVRAKKIFKFIQEHFVWNKKYGIFTDAKVKSAFENRIGNTGEINLSLINALRTANLNADMVLSSTRNNGVPAKVHPVIKDFNYILARVQINDKTYLLDATNKFLPFDMIPYKCLNGYGRVMDFEKGSFWTDIAPSEKSLKHATMMFKMDDEGNFKGKIRFKQTGYIALKKREKLFDSKEIDYLDDYEKNNFQINAYENTNLDNLEKPLIETFDVTVNSNLDADKIYLNPFFNLQFTENPFKLDERKYPVDFGYTREIKNIITIEVSDKYDVESLPKNVSLALPNDGGVLIYRISYKNNRITIKNEYSILRSSYSNLEYPYLKGFFKKIIESHKSPIVLKKVK